MTRKLRPAQGEEEEDSPGNEDDAHASDLEDLQTGPPGTLLIWPALVLVLLCALLAQGHSRHCSQISHVCSVPLVVVSKH